MRWNARLTAVPLMRRNVWLIVVLLVRWNARLIPVLLVRWNVVVICMSVLIRFLFLVKMRMRGSLFITMIMLRFTFMIVLMSHWLLMSSSLLLRFNFWPWDLFKLLVFVSLFYFWYYSLLFFDLHFRGWPPYSRWINSMIIRWNVNCMLRVNRS